MSDDLQREKIEQWSKLHDHEIVWLPPDMDASSFTLNRPGMKKALAMLKAGEADGIVAATQDRLTRRVVDFHDLLNRATTEGWNVVAIDTQFDLSTPAGRLMAGQMAGFAQYEYEVKRDGLNASRRNAVLTHGIHHGAIPPWGYSGWATRGEDKAGKALRGPLVADPANRVREAFEDAAAGISHPAFKRKYGDLEMSRVIPNRVYLGEAKSGEFVKEGAHSALVDEDLFRRANRRFKRAETGAGRPAKVELSPAMLAGGILRCGSCGHALTRQRCAKGDHYRCQYARCDLRVSISCASVEPYILEAAIAAHAEDTALRVADAEDFDLTALGKALDRAKAERDEVEALHASGKLSPVAYAGARTSADEAVLAAEVALSDAETASGWRSIPASRVREKIADDVEAQRSLIADFLRAQVIPFWGKRVPVEQRVALSRIMHGLPGAVPATVEVGKAVAAS